MAQDKALDKHEQWRLRTKPTLDFIASRLTSRRTAIDVGAADGLVTQWMIDQRFERVHAFEPAPDNFDRLSLTDWEGTVMCHNVALGDREEVLTLTGVGIGIGHSAHLTLSAETIGQRVKVRQLDSFNIADIDLIKIDVEGFESRVITGALRLIEQFKPMIMFERKKSWQLFSDEPPKAPLKRLGYKVVFKGPLDTVMTHLGR